MAKPGEDDLLDGLEITSIGSLYKGSWDKKYWSSSRGKDRYPYPVGYQVIRAHNGNMYKMEIHEGLKGPLFVITSDGHSCSGQTPDIAWEKCQKKGFTRMKIWHGKRFSCKIDGVEFFGFKNPLVQRLLRELVANVNGRAEQSSHFCNSTSKTEDDSRLSDECTYPDLLPYLKIPNKGKRTRKHETLITKSVGMARLKRSRPQDLICDSDAPALGQGNQKNDNLGCFMPPSSPEKEYGVHKHPGALALSPHLISGTIEEMSHFSVKEGPLLNSVDLSKMKEAVPTQEEREPDNSENCKSAGVANNLPEGEEPLCRFPDTELEEFNVQNVAEEENKSAVARKDCLVLGDGLCAPDTLDLTQDNTSSPASSPQHEGVYNEKEELIAADTVISEELVTESHPQEETGTSNTNASSEKSDYDSVGQEIAKSMMTLLLPQAVPLLKMVSRKKKASNSPSKVFNCTVKSQLENNEARYSADVPFPVLTLTETAHMEKEERMIQSRVLDLVGPSFGHTKSVVLDSFEDDQCGELVTKEELSHDTAEGNHFTFDEDSCPPNSWGQLVVQNDSSFSHVKTSGNKYVFCYDELHMTLNEKPQEGGECISESISACAMASNDINACAKLDENPIEVEIHSKEKHPKIVNDCTEAHPDAHVSTTTETTDTNQRSMVDSSKISSKEISFERGDAEPGIMFFSQIPNKVYTRKRARNVNLLARKDDVPLSESIIFRNFGEALHPEKDPATGTLLASEIHQMSSSNDKPCYHDLLGVQARLGGQSCGSHTENTTDSKISTNSMAPAISQSHALAFTSDEKDTSNVFQQSVSHVDKSESHLDKKAVGHKNIVDSNSPALILNQNTGFSGNNSLMAKGVQDGVDTKLCRKLKLNNELKGIVELVGCYVHPMPISSLSLSTKGNEICICVSCGLLTDRDRSIFIYRLAIQEPRVGCPSFVGHTSIILPIRKDYFGREVELERSGLHFAPDGQHLVLLDSIKTPYCRDGRIQCLCSTCKSDCLEENTVKIVQVKFGYVSVVVKLKAVEILHCILVCEPNHLVAVGESGRLHLWVMNSAWSAQTEEFILPANNYTSPGLMELKGIPKCASLVVGHNGVGEFSIWDISKRICLSSFSAPSTSIYQFFPISLFNWNSKYHVFSNSNVEEHINGIMAATKMWFSDNSANNSFLSFEGEDIAVWLLVSTISDSDAQHDYIPSYYQNHSVGGWRLALLVKDKVVLGCALDPRASAVGASAGHGIIGTCDGLAYMWELATGAKLGTLHHFKGGSISCVATDDSGAGALAVASDGGQLLVYRQNLHAEN
ncbi:hypothetical protein I3760_06G093900 [Carya illinoinensis]|nr:hypothetical protein I3760_06G093900 [Carya illinoinensis]